MNIRKATSADAAAIASCLLLAMEDIVYAFIGRNDPASAYAFMHYFTQKENNQYSWQNCRVMEHNNNVVAAVNVYDGAHLHQLRQPVVDHIRRHYQANFLPEDETAAGEWYIDSLGVLPAQRGRGIGTELLRVLITEFVHGQGQTLGLLVEEENTIAKQLYLKLGFCVVESQIAFGKKMVHLQCSTSVDEFL